MNAPILTKIIELKVITSKEEGDAKDIIIKIIETEKVIKIKIIALIEAESSKVILEVADHNRVIIVAERLLNFHAQLLARCILRVFIIISEGHKLYCITNDSIFSRKYFNSLIKI